MRGEIWSIVYCLTFCPDLARLSFKEGTLRGWENRCNREVPTVADHASLQMWYPHTMHSTLKDSAILGSVQYNY